MPFPSKKDLDNILPTLNEADPAIVHDRDSLKMVDRLKYDLCERIIIFINEKKISQRKLAKQLDVDPARINEIVKYKIHLFTLDKLIDYAEKIDPKIKISIAS